jgi:hypothetical protein
MWRAQHVDCCRWTWVCAQWPGCVSCTDSKGLLCLVPLTHCYLALLRLLGQLQRRDGLLTGLDLQVRRTYTHRGAGVSMCRLSLFAACRCCLPMRQCGQPQWQCAMCRQARFGSGCAWLHLRTGAAVAAAARTLTCDFRPGSFEITASRSQMSLSASCSAAVRSRSGSCMLADRLETAQPSSAAPMCSPYSTGDSASPTALATRDGSCLVGSGRIDMVVCTGWRFNLKLQQYCGTRSDPGEEAGRIVRINERWIDRHGLRGLSRDRIQLTSATESVCGRVTTGVEASQRCQLLCQQPIN